MTDDTVHAKQTGCEEVQGGKRKRGFGEKTEQVGRRSLGLRTCV